MAKSRLFFPDRPLLGRKAALNQEKMPTFATK
jgi:hypothetical protein